MEFFSETCTVTNEGQVPAEIAIAIGELRKGGFELEVLKAPDGFPLAGPLVRVKATTRFPSRPLDIDIHREEFLLLGNWRGYPAEPPMVRFDRILFPRGLPHLNQTRNTDPVWPCLTVQPLSEWFQSRSIVELVQRTEQWLADAISGQLMAGDENMFEPIFVPPEREYYSEGRFYVGRSGYAVLSLSRLLAMGQELTGTSLPNGILRARFIPLHSQVGLQPPVIAFDRLLANDEVWGDFPERFDFFGALRSGIHRTVLLPGIAVFLPESDAHVGPPRDDIAALLDWCSRMSAPESVSHEVSKCFSEWESLNLIGITFVIPRPRPVPGAPPECPNVDSVTALISRDGLVIPLQTLEPVDKRSIRRMSGVTESLPRSLLVGAGALGSKLGTHLVRTTGVDLDIVDPDILLEHNLVRHDLRRIHVGLSKAEGLADELQRMVTDFGGTGQTRMLQEALWDSHVVTSDYGLTLDMTALPRMSDVLAFFSELPRVFSAFVVLGGRVGIATIEGPERNPRADDLNAAIYAMAAENALIREWISSAEELIRVGSGGCAEFSVVMADDDISIHAARFSRVLRNEALEEASGGIWIFDLEGDTTRMQVGETRVVESDGWRIRVLSSVSEVIAEALEAHKPKEVAGYLHGIRDGDRKQIIIAHATVEPLIFQSEVGVEIDTSQYENPSGGTLQYLGSWHTHPGGGTSPSPTDENTIHQLSDLEGLAHPLLFLIAEPGEFAIHMRA